MAISFADFDRLEIQISLPTEEIAGSSSANGNLAFENLGAEMISVGKPICHFHLIQDNHGFAGSKQLLPAFIEEL